MFLWTRGVSGLTLTIGQGSSRRFAGHGFISFFALYIMCVLICWSSVQENVYRERTNTGSFYFDPDLWTRFESDPSWPWSFFSLFVFFSYYVCLDLLALVSCAMAHSPLKIPSTLHILIYLSCGLCGDYPSCALCSSDQLPSFRGLNRVEVASFSFRKTHHNFVLPPLRRPDRFCS